MRAIAVSTFIDIVGRKRFPKVESFVAMGAPVPGFRASDTHPVRREKRVADFAFELILLSAVVDIDIGMWCTAYGTTDMLGRAERVIASFDRTEFFAMLNAMVFEKFFIV